MLCQEALEDRLLRLFGGQAEGLQLQQLVAGDLADGGLVDQLGVGTVGGDGRDGLDAGVAHDDAVALNVAEALGVAHHHRVEDLVGTVLGHAAGDDAAAGVVAVELDTHIALGLLSAVGQQALGDHHLAAGFAEEVRLALGGVDAADLDRLHLHGGVLTQIDHGLGVHDVAAGLAGVFLAEVLFHIADLGIFADVEGVDAVVAAFVTAGVVDAAAGDNVHVAVVAHVEVVIDQLTEAAVADDDGDVAFLTLGAGLDADVNAGLSVAAGIDSNVLGGLTGLAAGVLADIEGAHGLAGQIGDLFQQSGVDIGDHCAPSFLSSTGQLPSVSARIRGKISSVVPRCAIWPPAMTTISSASLIMRS